MDMGLRTSTGCLEWPGDRDRDGYGKTWYQGRSNVRVHRLSYSLWNGPLEDGKLIRHRCDNPPCYEPTHLVQGTHLQNMADAVARGRRKQSGKDNPNARLTEYQVGVMRAMHAAGTSINKLALTFNISRRTAHDVVSMASWEALRGPVDDRNRPVVESPHADTDEADCRSEGNPNPDGGRSAALHRNTG